MLNKFINNNTKKYAVLTGYKKTLNDKRLMNKKRTSRLAVVQAVYMLNMHKNQNKQRHLFLDKGFEEVKAETFCRNVIYIYKNFVFKKTYQQQMVKGKYIDETFLFNTTKHISSNIEKINQIIEKHLRNKWRMDNLDILLTSILQTAIAESVMYSFISKKIIISEYTLLAKQFFKSKDVGFINAALHSYFMIEEK